MKSRPILFSAPMIRALLSGKKTQTRRIVKLRTGVAHEEIASVHPDGAKTGWIAWSPSPVSAEETARLYPGEEGFRCPYGVVGDRLWVKENAWISPVDFASGHEAALRDDKGRPRIVSYNATMDEDARRCARDYGVKLSPSIFMPRWASRITLELTSISVARVQSISEEDALAEGVEPTIHESWSFYDPHSDSYPSVFVEPTAEYIAEHNLENVRHHGPEVLTTARVNFKLLWWEINSAASWDSNQWCWVLEFSRVDQPQSQAKEVATNGG